MSNPLPTPNDDEAFRQFILAAIRLLAANVSPDFLTSLHERPDLPAAIRAVLPAQPEPLRRNGLEFQSRSDYEDHRRFYRQAMADVEQILQEGGRP